MDSWEAGAPYEDFMGRWSRQIAAIFLDWLGHAAGGNWLEVGCGTGALTEAVLERIQPSSLIAIDPSEAFIAYARSRLSDQRVQLRVSGADTMPTREGGYDAIVSGLVLNFIPDPAIALGAMVERLAPHGVVAAYVWDYAEGMQFLRLFWDEAAATDPAAAKLDEGVRFPLCRPEALASLFRGVGLSEVETSALEITTEFHDFEEYWQPFLAGTGPAPNYVAGLAPEARGRLRARLEQRLGVSRDAPARLGARSWAVRGRKLPAG